MLCGMRSSVINKAKIIGKKGGVTLIVTTYDFLGFSHMKQVLELHLVSRNQHVFFHDFSLSLYITHETVFEIAFSF